MEFKLPLPCTAIDIERFIHTICDHHGFPNCTVSTDGSNVILTYDEFSHPQFAPAMEGTSNAEIPRLKC